MKPLAGEFVVDATVAEVMAYCGDLRNVVASLPGVAEVREATPQAVIVVLIAGVSFLRGKVVLRLEQTAQEAEEMRFRGHGDAAGSVVDISAGLRAEAASSGGTTVYWRGEINVRGSLASIGAGLLTPIVNQNVQAFAAELKARIEGRVAELR